MNGHLDPLTLQDLLDGELAPAERRRAEAHVATCAVCAAELTSYRRVFGSLDAMPTWDPGPAFTERVLAHVLPELAPRFVARPAWVRPLAWSYGAAVFASIGGLAGALMLPAGRALAHDLAFAAVRSVVASVLFVFTALNDSLFRLADLGRLASGLGARTNPVWSVAGELLQQPVLLTTVGAAAVACAALIWWMRSREGRGWRGMQDVGLLGL